MIKLEHVNKYFNRHKKNQIHVIDNTSLELSSTGLVSLLGVSGCGKTTLLNAIGGLDKINSGKIYINGQKISKKCSRKIDKIRNLNIGYIFQDYNLVENMTVFDNVALSLKINGLKNKEEIKKRVEYILEKVGMYKYRNRPASMLSGGERQRVGIARAIVKNPNIIIADEPTGNLDSKNTIEVMNIIKAISKTKLVILVTHEKELAEFYSTRILEIEDGKIVNDRKNNHDNDLDYKMENKIYLKDFKIKNNIKDNNVNIDFYSNEKENININIIVQNGNIYIENKNNNKLEIINDSNIEVIDDHYKKLSKEEAEKYEFDMDSVSNKKYKPKYSSILNPLSLIINGFKKVRDYSFIKKLLLLGFFFSGLFIMYSISSLFGINRIDESKFITYNKDYLLIKTNNISINDYKKLESDDNIDYIIPTDSIVSFNIKYKDYYQSYDVADNYSGSLSDINTINKDEIVFGEYPTNNKEIVIDKLVFNNNDTNIGNFLGINNAEDLIGREVFLNDFLKYTIVGVVDKGVPNIYVNKDEFNNIIYFSTEGFYQDINSFEVLDYKLFEDDIKLKKGKYPKKDYEVIVNYNYKDMYQINKSLDTKVNGKKLKVVGYYTSNNIDKLLVSNNTIKYSNIENKNDISIYTKNKSLVLEQYKNKYNIKDSYEYSKDKYLLDKKDDIKVVTTTSLVFLIISMIEIYLMVRSSFLSRIKEVGIFRAIGVKKFDIYKMFTGEIIAITTLSSLLGVLLMSYSLHELSFINSINDKFLINSYTIVISILFVYAFNLLIGLLPVYRTIRKTPAQILSRNDI